MQSGAGAARDCEGEGALRAALVRGDAEAYDAFVRQHRQRMLAVALRYLRDEDAARDVVQDAFLNALRGLPRFEGRAKLSTWLQRIVMNAALGQLRTAASRASASRHDLPPRLVAHEDVGAVPAIDGPERSLARRELRERVRACIAQLPDRHRTVLWLREIEELDIAETALRLGITPQAVKNRQHRARRALRELLVAEGEGAVA